MRIIDLIEKLQMLYNTYTDEDKAIMGEPEIMIDLFRLVDDVNEPPYHRTYAGYSPNIVFSNSGDGVCKILSAFYEDQETETQELPSSPVSKS